MKYLYGILLSLLIIGCGNNRSSNDTATYFGGHIIKPNSKFVLLYKDENLVDSIELDDNNRFIITLDSVEDGLYNFYHEPEYQYVHIEKGDSVLMRLNTIEFDESLVFSGKGAVKNNFLIDMYLMHEKEDRYINGLYSLPHDQFSKKIDSLYSIKQEKYNDLVANNDLSDHATKIARATVDCRYYSLKERYQYLHRNKLGLDHFDVIPKDFYAYRKDINLNDKELSYFRPYRRYLLTHISNLAYNHCAQEISSDNTLNYNTRRLELIDSMLKIDDLKNDLLRYVAYEFMLENQDIDQNETFLIKFFKTSTSNKHDQEINQLYHSIRAMQPGQKLPYVRIANAGSNITDLDKMRSDRITVYYFWSLKQKRHMKNVLRKVKKYKKQYPTVDFVGINLDGDHGAWLKGLSDYQLDGEDQLRITDYDKTSKDLVINSLNKLIVVDGQGTIVEGFANIHDLNRLKVFRENDMVAKTY
ncbi:TlpA family protein disulfide reductase [Sungkyunkwania multivorans]|uniref:TlpA family protein disulfide reductase n=1 Tax=Sungkyunkwania multivorans TaxID=1173618 RepID=A0ABW3CX65_9FLAO